VTALAIDTSLDACAAALHGEGARLERREIMARGHTERLPVMVRDIMAEAELRFDQLARVAVTVGPGTFTGIRIGLAFARGLGLALGIPVIGFNTLEAIALGIEERPLLVANVARDDEVYAAYFDGEGSFKPEVLTVSRLAARMEGKEYFAAGNAALSRKAAYPKAYPSVSRMAALSLLRTASSPPEPLYLRAADAKPQAGYVPRPFIRSVESHEAAILAALHADCFDTPWDAKAFAALMAMPGSSALFALEAGAPVGFVLARAAADEAEIIAIGVRPSHRRKGIARRLLRELNIPPRLFIEVAEGNAAARAFYDSEGFARAGERRGYYARPDGGREDAIVMRRDARP
jgi:tRNA threonylcarbamoyladenosine biosynthesis protein TsaB